MGKPETEKNFGVVAVLVIIVLALGVAFAVRNGLRSAPGAGFKGEPARGAGDSGTYGEIPYQSDADKGRLITVYGRVEGGTQQGPVAGAEVFLFIGDPEYSMALDGDAGSNAGPVAAYSWSEAKGYTNRYGGFCIKDVRIIPAVSVLFVSVVSDNRIIIPFVPVEPGAGEEVRLGTLHPARGAVRIAGVVNDQAARGVAAAIIYLSPSVVMVDPKYGFPPEARSRVTPRVLTGIDGRFAFEDVGLGEYTIAANVDGVFEGMRSVSVTPADEGGSLIVSFAVVRKPRISGVVTSLGRPFSGARVEVLSPEGGILASAVSGANGLFSIEDKGERPVFLRVSKEYFTTYESRPIFDTVAGVLADIVEAEKVSLILANEGGENARRARFRLLGHRSAGHFEEVLREVVATSPTAVFELDDFDFRRATKLIVAADGFQPISVPVEDIRSAGERALKVDIRAHGLLTGRVLDPAGGSPLPGARITVIYPAGFDDALRDTFPAETAADGTFAVRLTGSGYEILAEHPRFPATVISGISVAGGETIERDIVMSSGGTIAGRIVDAEGLPILGASVEAISAGGANRSKPVRLTAAGRFNIDGLKPGAVSLFLKYGYLESFDDGTSHEVVRTVEIARIAVEESRTAAVDIFHRRKVSLSGRVTIDGEPAFNCRISIFGEDRPIDAAGRFEFAGLPSGFFEAVVKRVNGDIVGRRSVEIGPQASGYETEIELSSSED